MPAADVMRSLGSSPSGLTTEEASRRLTNADEWRVAPPTSKGILALLWRQVANPFVAILLGASAVSGWTGEWLDAGVTLAIVVANIGLGFFQEFQADREFFALQNYLPKEVTVRRGDQVMTIAADLLVPGDIALFHAGKNILCDGRILNAVDCTVSEAALSGESASITKSAEPSSTGAEIFARTSMVFAGTSMMSGQATVLVTALGTQTEFGKIGTMTATITDRATPLEEEMKRLSTFLTKGILFLAVIILIVAMARGESAIAALALAAALAIAAIPEGLSMTVTVVLSVAMRRMFKKGVLVRHLNATETLGCINVLCVDKTGTLTTGEMTIVEVQSSTGVLAKDDLEVHDIWKALGCFAQQHLSAGQESFAGSATSDAVKRFVAEKICVDEASCTLGSRSIAFIPFQTSHKFSACIPEGKTGTAYLMGAPEALLARSNADAKERSRWEVTMTEMASRGLRVIALAECAATQTKFSVDAVVDVRITGLFGIEDPLRPTVRQAVIDAHNAGIRTVMMTGDHPETARHIAKEAFGEEKVVVMLGEDFAKLSASEQGNAIRSIDVFARMLPEHKMLVINAFHAIGARVGMTGDGVNDAPALKSADVGIAVGHATEVAKEASDMVLLDGDFGSIIAAVAEGRTVFSNARNVTIFLLALGLGETIAILGSFLFGIPPVLTPLLLLWLNVITDGIPGMFFAFEGGDARAMTEPPRKSKDGLISKDVRRLLLDASVALTVVIMILLGITRSLHIDVLTMHTVFYLFIGTLGTLFVFVTRSVRTSMITNMFAKTPLWYGVLFGLAVFLLPFFVPSLRSTFELTTLSPNTILLTLAATLLVLLPLDLAKKRLS